MWKNIITSISTKTKLIAIEIIQFPYNLPTYEINTYCHNQLIIIMKKNLVVFQWIWMDDKSNIFWYLHVKAKA
jgi:hypothetical protein